MLDPITKGTTSKVIEVTLRDSTTGAGKTGVAHGDVTASYVREGGTRTAITLAAGSAGDIYSSGKWAEVDATNCKGMYQLHIPDAALATGVEAVTLQLQASGVLDKPQRIPLIDVDLRDSADMGLSVFPTNFGSLGINGSGHVSRVVLVDTTTANTDMRGTDSANTTVPPTAAAIRSEMDSNSTRLAAIRSGVGFLICQEIGAVPAPQTATAQYSTTWDGTNFQIDHAGLTETGVRGTATLSNPA